MFRVVSGVDRCTNETDDPTSKESRVKVKASGYEYMFTIAMVTEYNTRSTRNMCFGWGG